MSPLTFPDVPAPVVSVLMVTHGALEWVERSLRALVEHTPPIYELIVVDNASTDGTAEYVGSQLSGARVICSEHNLGFGVGNNLAAAHAVSEYLCFLNSDALVTPDWLATLLPALDRDGIGAVVPMYVHPDGSVQEAGCAIEPDGNVARFGDGDNPSDPAHGFARAVPYASAACMVMSRRVFTELGGFDPRYRRVYYEDTDLALELETHGLSVWYEPRVRVVHAQGASPLDRPSAHDHFAANKAYFTDRWASQLTDRPQLVDVVNEPHRLVAARDHLAHDRVLIVSSALPDDTSAIGTTLNAIVELLPGALVTLVVCGSAPSREAEQWLTRGVEVVNVDDLERFLARRLFHYGAVWITDAAAESPVGDVLDATQPQAVRLTDPPSDVAALAEALLSVGLTPRVPPRRVSTRR